MGRKRKREGEGYGVKGEIKRDTHIKERWENEKNVRGRKLSNGHKQDVLSLERCQYDVRSQYQRDGWKLYVCVH